LTGQVYHIEVKTADIAWTASEGTDGEVYIYINGSTGSSDRLVLQGGFEAGDIDSNDVLLMNLGEVSSKAISVGAIYGVLHRSVVILFRSFGIMYCMLFTSEHIDLPMR